MTLERYELEWVLEVVDDAVSLRTMWATKTVQGLERAAGVALFHLVAESRPRRSLIRQDARRAGISFLTYAVASTYELLLREHREVRALVRELPEYAERLARPMTRT